MYRKLINFKLNRFSVLANEFIRNTSKTVDSQELLHFRSKVDYWWDENGQFKPLHTMNFLRVPFIRDTLKNRGLLQKEFIDSSTPLKGINIIDVGCGGGILAEPLAKLGANVTGIDACEELIDCAQSHADQNKELNKCNLQYIYGTLEEKIEDFRDKFDAVVSSECIEHVADKKIFLKSCVDVLKPDGSIFLTTINKTNASWLLAIIGAEYIMQIVPKGTHDWKKFISPQEIQKILEHYNCQTRNVQGLYYNACTNNWNWISNCDVNYALHAIKCN